MVDYSSYDASDLMEDFFELCEDEEINAFEEIDKALPEGMLTMALERVSEKYGIDLR